MKTTIALLNSTVPRSLLDFGGPEQDIWAVRRKPVPARCWCARGGYSTVCALLIDIVERFSLPHVGLVDLLVPWLEMGEDNHMVCSNEGEQSVE